MTKIRSRIDERYAREVISFMQKFLPKVTLGRVKIISWGYWQGSTDGVFRLMIDWKVEE